MTRHSPLFLCGLIALSGCLPRRIPGTDLDDTPDVRAIMTVMELYRSALEAQDAKALVDLADPSFQDDAGTPNVADDLDFKALQNVLPQRLSKLADVKLDLDVRKIDVSPDRRHAVATYYFVARFRPLGVETKAQREMDLKQMTFLSDGKAWRITSGY
ncbi:MAG: DUF4440 domain-containing protein [Myxococcaceae bacterium]